MQDYLAVATRQVMRKGGSSGYDSLAALGPGSAPADCRYHWLYHCYFKLWHRKARTREYSKKR